MFSSLHTGRETQIPLRHGCTGRCSLGGGGRRPRRPATAIKLNRVVGRLRAAEDVRPYRWRASRVPNGGVKVVWLGTDRRLSFAQNPVVRGNVARPLAAVEMRLWSAAVLSF